VKVFCVSLLLLALASIASADALSCSPGVPNLAAPGETALLLSPFHVAGGNCPIDLGGASAIAVISSTSAGIASSLQLTTAHFFQGEFLGSVSAPHRQVKWYLASFPDSASNFGVADDIDVFSSAETVGQLPWQLDSKPVAEPQTLFLTACGLLAIGGMLRRRWF
jgi:hypothetical protein